MIQISKRHHYVPQFYLKQWRSKGGGIFNYVKNQYGEVDFYSKFEKACGFEFDLYMLERESLWDIFNYQPDYIEKEFFKKLDDSASVIHKKLLKMGLKNFTTEDRYVWAMFLRSLIERNPERISEVFQHFESSNLKNDVMLKIQSSEIVKHFDLDVMQKNQILLQITREICNPKYLEFIVNMRWAICDCAATGESYLTSDKPLLINGGIKAQASQAMYSIALSPTKLLVIHLYDNDFIEKVAHMHNVMIVKNARSYVYSHQELVDTKCYKFSKFLTEIGNSDF